MVIRHNYTANERGMLCDTHTGLAVRVVDFPSDAMLSDDPRHPKVPTEVQEATDEEWAHRVPSSVDPDYMQLPKGEHIERDEVVEDSDPVSIIMDLGPMIQRINGG